MGSKVAIHQQEAARHVSRLFTHVHGHAHAKRYPQLYRITGPQFSPDCCKNTLSIFLTNSLRPQRRAEITKENANGAGGIHIRLLSGSQACPKDETATEIIQIPDTDSFTWM